MASEAQVAANRRNARKSTGPKTDAGRAVASRNALRHGLTAEQLVLFDERAEDLARFREELRAALDPADAVEEALAERIVLCAWRLRRAARIEAGLLNAEAAAEEDQGSEPGLGSAFRAAFGLGTVSRYEAALDRALSRAHAMLERRQARRRGEAVPAPIAVEVGGLEAAEPRAVNHENYETKPISPPDLPARLAAALGLPAPGAAAGQVTVALPARPSHLDAVGARAGAAQRNARPP